MGRRILALGLTLGLCVLGIDAFPQAPSDPEVAKGIQQVEQGDYDAAIFTLDGAARRLAADPKKSKELSEAYLYLGIAFLGKGHEAAAKAKFREAVKQIKDLSLSPDKFAPRVIDLVEAAKAEASAAPAGAKPVVAAAPPKKGGGSKKVLLIGGAVAVAGGGAALALGGGGGGQDGCDTVWIERQGMLAQPNSEGAEFPAGPAEGGGWSAEVNWTGPTPLPNVDLFVNVVPSQDTVATGNLEAPGKRVARWQGAAGARYLIKIFLDEHATTSVNYNVIISGPCL